MISKKNNKKPYREVFDLQSQCIALLSPAGRIFDINESFLALLNTSRRDIVGQLIWETTPLGSLPIFASDIKSTFLAALDDKDCSSFVVRIKGVDGDTRIVNFTLSPALDAKGSVEWCLLEANDISDK